jgi:hypothetical protein
MNRVDMTDIYWIASDTERGARTVFIRQIRVGLAKSPSATAAADVMRGGPIRGPDQS